MFQMNDEFVEHRIWVEYSTHWTSTTHFHVVATQVTPEIAQLRKSAVGNVAEVIIDMHDTDADIADKVRWRIINLIKQRIDQPIICTGVQFRTPRDKELVVEVMDNGN